MPGETDREVSPAHRPNNKGKENLWSRRAPPAAGPWRERACGGLGDLQAGQTFAASIVFTSRFRVGACQRDVDFEVLLVERQRASRTGVADLTSPVSRRARPRESWASGSVGASCRGFLASGKAAAGCYPSKRPREHGVGERAGGIGGDLVAELGNGRVLVSGIEEISVTVVNARGSWITGKNCEMPGRSRLSPDKTGRSALPAGRCILALGGVHVSRALAGCAAKPDPSPQTCRRWRDAGSRTSVKRVSASSNRPSRVSRWPS